MELKRRKRGNDDGRQWSELLPPLLDLAVCCFASHRSISSWCVTVAQAAEDERGAGATVQVGGRGAAEVEVGRGGHHHSGGGGAGAAVGFGAVVVQEAPEQVPVDGHRRLVRHLAVAPAVVHGRHPHAPEHRRPAHLPRQAVLERRVCGGRGNHQWLSDRS